MPESNQIPPASNVASGEQGNVTSTETSTTTAAPPAMSQATVPASTDPVIPEKYEFSFEDKTEIDVPFVEKMTPVLKELKLTQEQATKLATIYKGHVSEQMAKIYNDHATQVADWGKEAEADKEIGGSPEKFKTSLASIDKAIRSYGSEEMRNLLDETGLGNNVHVLRFLAKVGATVREDTPPDGNYGDKSSQTKAPAGTRLYPTMK